MSQVPLLPRSAGQTWQVSLIYNDSSNASHLTCFTVLANIWLMDKLPSYQWVERPQVRKNRLTRVVTLCGVAAVVWIWSTSRYSLMAKDSVKLPIHAEETLQKCSMLHVQPGPPPDFARRTQSDRFVDGTRATLLRNASVWTGDSLQYEIQGADILLDKGIIKFVGHASEEDLAVYDDLLTVDVSGSWVTPG